MEQAHQECLTQEADLGGMDHKMGSHKPSSLQGLTVACPRGPATCLVEEILLEGWRTVGFPGT